MSKDIGTLQEIGAKVGDVVAYYWDNGNVTEEIATDKMISEWITDTWRIISRANQGPVREVMRKEIVPGVYGRIDVQPWTHENCVFVGITDTDKGKADVWHRMYGAELTAAIDTLTAIRDAMADCSGCITTAQAR